MFFACTDLAVPHDIMHHVVRVESSGNPYAIGVVGGRLQRQPKIWLKQSPQLRCWNKKDLISPWD